MIIAFAVFLIVFSVFLHELGHALFMRKYGVGIQIFSFGLPFPIKVAFSSKKIFDGATLQITPLLLGAFVKPTDEGEERIKKLPYAQQADIYGAGPLANILFSGLLFVFYAALMSEAGVLFWQWKTRSLLIVCAVLAAFFGRKPFSRYLMLPAGLTLMGMVVRDILRAPTEAMVGPVGIAKIVGGVTGLPEAILLAMLLSFSIGLLNILPLIPLDGGRSCDALIGKYMGSNAQSFYRWTSGSLFFSLIGLAVYSDFVR